MGFEKYQVSAQNQNGISLQKRLFAMKADRKSVFHSCETHILAQLEITVLYLCS
jgi:hypothetical protein